MTQSWPPPTPPVVPPSSPPPTILPPPPPDRPPRGRAQRPKFGFVVAAALGVRFGRDVLERVAFARYGLVGVLLVVLGGIAVVLLWRAWYRSRVRAKGDQEFTADDVVRQLAGSGLEPPAFPEDGTLLGASVLAVNQRAKVLEVNTEYELFGSDGRRLGFVRQVGQSRGKQIARVVTAFDQFFTHRFEVVDPSGAVVLRIVRPRKLFLTRVHVLDEWDRLIGTIRQRNVFWKIRFDLLDPTGNVVGHLRAENVRAWDFHILDRYERELAVVVKSWEGWGKTAFTRADRYAVRIGEPLPYPMRQLVVAASLAVDLALKQDARGFG